MEIHELHRKLNNQSYICGKKFASLVAASLNTTPVAGAFLNGPIGTGKSYLPEIIEKIIPSSTFFYQCFPGTREDELLLKMLPSENTISGIATYDGVIIDAVKATHCVAHDEKVILVLDEWDKTRPSADAFLLHFLQKGTIKYAHYDLHADLSKLIIFLTLNMERELSEPLLRRLPVIDFSPLPPSMVLKALQSTHSGHPFLYNVVVLYERSLQAELPKPATLQELRQLLDALSCLGSNADWDSLVFQFVTKTEENHELLRQMERNQKKPLRKFRPRLNAEAYSLEGSTFLEVEADNETLALPSLKKARDFSSRIDVPDESPDIAQASGILKFSDETYDALVRLIDHPSDSAYQLDDLAQVHGEYITLIQAISLQNIDFLSPLWGHVGEVLITEPFATLEDVKALQTWSDIRIVKFSTQEILARTNGVDLRWLSDSGVEIIVNLKSKQKFQDCFGSAWGAEGEGKWIGQNGLIYARYQAFDPGDQSVLGKNWISS